MTNFLKSFFKNKSRFYFNISFIYLLNKTVKYIIDRQVNYQDILTKKLQKYFTDPNMFFFNHGRGGFYFLLKHFKNKSKNKVLINSLTLFEMVNMIIYAGYDPVFVDNKKNSFETNTVHLIDKFSEELSFVVVTHLNGINKEIFDIKDKIEQINKTRDKNNRIYLIEDVAVGLGAKFNDVYTGSIGDFSILSFNIMKNITSLTGGALIDNHKVLKIDKFAENKLRVSFFDIVKKISFVSLLQFLNSRLIFPFFFVFIRFAQKNNFNFFLRKYRTDFETYTLNKIPPDFTKNLSNFQMYLLIDQVEEIDEKNKLRINNSLNYYDRLKNNDKLIFPQTNFNHENIFLEFPIICKEKKYKDYILQKSLNNYVDIKNYYYKNCESEKSYKIYKVSSSINSKYISENIIMLPNNINYCRSDFERIINLFD